MAGQTQNKISIVINTYNAERYLEQVLNALRGFDEIVVCDMESTDSTVRIAERHGCRVVTFPKGDNKICEPARDFAIHSAGNEWVLVVDADEIVPPALRDYLYDLINNKGFNDSLSIGRINPFWGHLDKGNPDYQLRFFRKSTTVWPPVIHARPVVEGEIKNAPYTDGLCLIHLDDPTISQRIAKMNNYSDYEVTKRIEKSYSAAQMLFRPIWFFIKEFFVGKGYRNGKRGIVKAYMASIYQMILLSKLTDAQQNTGKDKK